MPPVTSVPQRGGQCPSTFDKMKMGAIMGGLVGLSIGFIFGTYTIFKVGPGPNGIIRSLGQYMLGSAATFGFFMSIGSAIRTEGVPGSLERWEQMRKSPVIMMAAAQRERERR